MRYRGDLDIMADILRVTANGGAKKTHILYQANLSYRLLQKYLNDALKARLLRFDDGDRRYFLTDRGLLFLSIYREYKRRNAHVEKQLNDLNDKRRRLKELCLSGGGYESV